VKHLSNFTITVEYQDGTEELCTFPKSLRGLRDSKGKRPAYLTVVCNVAEQPINKLLTSTSELFQLSYLLLSDSPTLERIRFKPYWLHKQIFKGN